MENYRLVLKQRNALLRQKAHQKLFSPWDKQLVELANELDIMRSNYFEKWSVLFQFFLSQLTDVPCSIHYYKGWDKKGTGSDFTTILQNQFATDVQRQYTHAGAHQADIYFDLSSKKAKLLLSRGQQKIVLIALKLAQASLVSTDCVYLFDDIAAELDSHHLSRLTNCLSTIKGQFFITALDNTTLKLLEQSLELKSYALESGMVHHDFITLAN